MSASSVSPDRPPRRGLCAPVGDETPAAGTERRTGVLNGPQAGSQGFGPDDPSIPVQLALPPELLAAMTLPAPIPSARRRGRPVRSTPDIANYQPEENR